MENKEKNKRYLIVVVDSEETIEEDQALVLVRNGTDLFMERDYGGRKPKQLKVGEVIWDKINDAESIFILRVL
jgi:hypothetical protein